MWIVFNYGTLIPHIIHNMLSMSINSTIQINPFIENPSCFIYRKSSAELNGMINSHMLTRMKFLTCIYLNGIQVHSPESSIHVPLDSKVNEQWFVCIFVNTSVCIALLYFDSKLHKLRVSHVENIPLVEIRDSLIKTGQLDNWTLCKCNFEISG